MKKSYLLLVFAAFLLQVSCQLNKNSSPNLEKYEVFGSSFEEQSPMNSELMTGKYNSLKPGDSLLVSFETEIQEVCQKRGCWMKLKLDDEMQSFVKFKDYDFFVPMDAAGKKTIVQGKAFVNELSVSELRHFAKDAGKSKEEVIQINEAERTYSFLATSVLIEK
jgi:hypothetical protein